MSDIPADFTFGAVYVNHGDHAYAKVRFDPQSMAWFTENLGAVRDPLTRACIWRYFWILVMDGQISSLEYLDFVTQQLPKEKNDQIIMLGLLNLQVLMKSYIPNELVVEKKGELFDTLITLLRKNVSKDPIVDQLFDFLATKENISMAIDWL